MYLRKQVTQLASKMRFVAAQFLALLDDDLWLELAGHANAMARRAARARRPASPASSSAAARRSTACSRSCPPDVIEPLRDVVLLLGLGRRAATRSAG